PLRFPISAHSILTDDEGHSLPHEAFALTDTRVSASIEANPALDRVELLGDDGKTLLSIDAAQLKAAASPGRGAGGPVGDGSATLETLRAQYPSIRFAGPADVD